MSRPASAQIRHRNNSAFSGENMAAPMIADHIKYGSRGVSLLPLCHGRSIDFPSEDAVPLAKKPEHGTVFFRTCL
jgi:hypothetical protein